MHMSARDECSITGWSSHGTPPAIFLVRSVDLGERHSPESSNCRIWSVQRALMYYYFFFRLFEG